MTERNRRELSHDEMEILRDEPLPTSEDEQWVDDEWANFRILSEEEQKWALIQLQLDQEAKKLDVFLSGE